MKIFGVEIRRFGEPRIRNNPGNPLHPFSGFGGKSVEDFYRKFHYKQPKRKRYIELPDRPDAAFVIGRLVNLTYLPFGSSGKPHELHIHKFGDYGYKMNDKVNEMPLIMGDNKHNLFIARDRSKFFLDGRGIVG